MVSESENEPNRTETVRFGSNRSEPNSNRLFENSVEPNRTRTGFLKLFKSTAMLTFTSPIQTQEVSLRLQKVDVIRVRFRKNTRTYFEPLELNVFVRVKNLAIAPVKLCESCKNAK